MVGIEMKPGGERKESELEGGERETLCRDRKKQTK